MQCKIPARIRRMSRRRQKVAIKRWLQKDMSRYMDNVVIERVMHKKDGEGFIVDATWQPRRPVEHISIQQHIHG